MSGVVRGEAGFGPAPMGRFLVVAPPKRKNRYIFWSHADGVYFLATLAFCWSHADGLFVGLTPTGWFLSHADGLVFGGRVAEAKNRYIFWSHADGLLFLATLRSNNNISAVQVAHIDALDDIVSKTVINLVVATSPFNDVVTGEPEYLVAPVGSRQRVVNYRRQ